MGVFTDIGRNLREKVPDWAQPVTDELAGYLFKSVDSGAQTTVFCCVDESLEDKSGRYYADCAEKVPDRRAFDDQAAKKLWALSADVVGDISPLSPAKLSTTGSSDSPLLDGVESDASSDSDTPPEDTFARVELSEMARWLP